MSQETYPSEQPNEVVPVDENTSRLEQVAQFFDTEIERLLEAGEREEATKLYHLRLWAVKRIIAGSIMENYQIAARSLHTFPFE